ncbi:MAG: hypothetical protein AAGA48_27115 [Myxococcota bacterium]
MTRLIKLALGAGVALLLGSEGGRTTLASLAEVTPADLEAAGGALVEGMEDANLEAVVKADWDENQVGVSASLTLDADGERPTTLTTTVTLDPAPKTPASP